MSNNISKININQINNDPQLKDDFKQGNFVPMFRRPQLTQNKMDELKELQCKLPTSIQSFFKFSLYNNYYIDKTDIILQLINSKEKVFFTRPRRFGKSTTITTICDIFKGSFTFNV